MPIIRNCLTCGKEFETLPCRVKNGQGKYCSVKCVPYRFKKGNKHPDWKGEKVGYFGLHKWVESHLGKPKKCEECGTITAKRFEWANISKEYKRSNGLKDWKRLCVKCHRSFDECKINGEKSSSAKLTSKQVLEIRHLYAPYNYTFKMLANKFNVSTTIIFNVVKKKRWKHL